MHSAVFEAYFNFEAFVRRHYGVNIYMWKSDNESTIITPEALRTQRKTGFETWVEEEGMTLELSPTNTHESNSVPEHAKQEVINKANAMRQDAGLPPDLWTEVLKAAAYLYNRSPCYTNNM
jgi:hypothetical protein